MPWCRSCSPGTSNSTSWPTGWPSPPRSAAAWSSGVTFRRGHWSWCRWRSPGLSGVVPATGRCSARVPRPADRLFVTGPLGGAAAGLAILRSPPDGERRDATGLSNLQAFRRPVARLDGVRWRGGSGASAAIDISDGLAPDLGHLARASGIRISLDTVPTAAGRHRRRGAPRRRGLRAGGGHPGPGSPGRGLLHRRAAAAHPPGWCAECRPVVWARCPRRRSAAARWLGPPFLSRSRAGTRHRSQKTHRNSRHHGGMCHGRSMGRPARDGDRADGAERIERIGRIEPSC